MRLSALVVACLASIVLVACGRGGSSRLEGHWKGTFAEGVPADALTSAIAFAKGMEIEVKGDVITVVAGQDRQSGRFTIDTEDKSTIVLHTDRDGAGDKQTFSLLGDRVMKWTVTEGKPATITFVRD